jgi:excisionase family DNA binding protein
MTHVPNSESCDANSAKAPTAKTTNLDRNAGLLSVMQAAEYLNISRAHLYELLKRGELARIKLGRRTLFERRDLDAFAARHSTTTTEI